MESVFWGTALICGVLVLGVVLLIALDAWMAAAQMDDFPEDR